jgi:AraC family transcriptional regulator, ethanolamine operon transcriptional activator
MSSVLADSPMPKPGLDVMSRLFDNFRFEAVALREGGLKGVFGSRFHHDASLCGFVFDFPCHGRFLLPGNRYLLCYVHQTGVESWCTGMPLRSGTVLIVLPGNSCELMLGAQSMVSMLTAPLHDRVARSVEGSCTSFGSTGHRFSMLGPECHAGTALQFRYESAFHALTDPRSDGACAPIDALFDTLVDPRLLEDLMIHPGARLSMSGGYHLHYRAVRRAVDFMRANLQRDIYIEELAHAAELSDRGLRYAFSDLLGLSPTRYLSLLRLHEAHRQLSSSGTGRLSVKSVAMNCGWWDLSRFAAHYRRAFGEHPRDTLMRACRFAT